MGQCFGKVPSQNVTGDDLIAVTGLRYATLRRDEAFTTTGNETGLAKERIQLKELLDAQSKGLIFTKRVFSVLPDVSTLADVTFTISCERRAENDENLQDDGSKLFQFRLAGYGAVVGLFLSLAIQPRVGPLAGKHILCWWQSDTFYVRGGGRSHSFSFVTHSNRLFNSVQEFCKMCLYVVHHVPGGSEFNEFDDNLDDQPDNIPIQASHVQPQLLSQLALRTLLCYLDVIPTGVPVPTTYLPKIYRGYGTVELILYLWPSSLYNGRGCKITTLKGLMYCEFSHMIMLRYGISSSYQLKWYENFKPVLGKQQISTNSKRIDCFVVNSHSEDTFYSEENYIQTTVPIIISLVGVEVKDLYVNPSMTVREFDKHVRQLFGLKSDSFLVLLPEGDLSPHYSRNDQWKCVFPMSIGAQTQHRLFGSSSHINMPGSEGENRRSFQRNGSTRRSNYGIRNHSTSAVVPRLSSSNYGPRSSLSSNGQSPFHRSTNTSPSPLALATKLLSNKCRNFPMHQNIHGLSIEEIYEMPMYNFNLERYGIYGHSVVQVFEVTGPTVPIAFCGSAAGGQNTTTLHHKIRSINLMDINPTWPIPTLTQYVEAIICPRQAVTQKKITLGANTLVDSVDVMKLKVSEILDIWKPIWWRTKGSPPTKVSLKDITPEDVLTIENMN